MGACEHASRKEETTLTELHQLGCEMDASLSVKREGQMVVVFGYEIWLNKVHSSSTQFPEELALWLIVELRLAEMLQEDDKVSSKMCLCGALGVALRLAIKTN
ncbi:hypothetical protein ACFX2K_006478 [Malus domestica]